MNTFKGLGSRSSVESKKRSKRHLTYSYTEGYAGCIFGGGLCVASLLSYFAVNGAGAPPMSMQDRLATPCLAVMGLSLLSFGVFWLIKQRRTRIRIGRKFQGRCQVCGYDLRITPDQCSECGTITRPSPED